MAIIKTFELDTKFEFYYFVVAGRKYCLGTLCTFVANTN